MAVIRATDKDTAMLARLMRAEAEGEGKQGMLMVGRVGVNHVRFDCFDLKTFVPCSKWFSRVMVVLKQLPNPIFSSCSQTG